MNKQMTDEKDMPVIDTSAPAETVAETQEPVAIEDLSPQMAALTDDIIGAMKSVYDPEIPVNIVDLGLVYDLKISGEDEARVVEVKMTLTAQGCGMGPVIADDAKTRIENIPNVSEVSVDIVWEPQWNPRMMSAEGKKVLGLE